MQLDKFMPLTTIYIWEPRYHDNKVLLSVNKVKAATTKYLKIKFTKAPSMEGDWVVDKTQVKKCKVETNGTIAVYAVPLNKLLPLTISKRSEYAD